MTRLPYPRLRPLVLTSCIGLLLVGCQTPLIKSTSAPPTETPAPEKTPVEPGPVNTPVMVAEASPVEHPAVRNHMMEPPQPPDLWTRLRAGFALPMQKDRRIEQHLSWFKRHPDYLARCLDRAEPYLPWILERVEADGLPTEIALLPIVESGFNPFAYSHGRAAGLWQFIPATGKHYGLKQNWWYDGRRDWVAATDAALAYLKANHERFDGDWLLAIAAYNAGEGNVHKALRLNRKRGKSTDFWSLDLPRETENYVPKLLALRQVFSNPQAYGLALPEEDDAHRLELIETGGQIDLSLAAELAQLPLDELYRLNPGFNRWATPPNGPHRLVLPHDAVNRFEQALAELPKDKRVKWTRHRIGAGDTLIGLASRYHTTVDLLKQVNHLRSHRIRRGDYLIIPTARKSLDTYTLSATQRRLATQNRTRNGYKTTHVVSAGDSFWDLAREYDVGVRELAKWNGMAPTDTLRIGQKLVIWSKQPDPDATNIALQRVRYRVRKGDSLARISQRFKVTIGDLEKWNNLNRRNYLQPGQILTLYVDVTRQADNS